MEQTLQTRKMEFNGMISTKGRLLTHSELQIRRIDRLPKNQNDRICSCHFVSGEKIGDPVIFSLQDFEVHDPKRRKTENGNDTTNVIIMDHSYGGTCNSDLNDRKTSLQQEIKKSNSNEGICTRSSGLKDRQTSQKQEIKKLTQSVRKLNKEISSRKTNGRGLQNNDKQNGMEDDTPLFDAKILNEIDFSNCKGEYKPAISNKNPGDNLRLRPLSLGDYDRGFLKLLSQLTKVGGVTREQFTERFNCMKAAPGSYFVIVIENTQTEEIVASATLAVEFKFIHCTGARGRVEDVVVSKECRGQQLGKLLLDCLTLLAPKVGCYKLSLECKDPLVNFYSTFGFSSEAQQNYMVQRFWD